MIQKRALDKYHSGGLWANACCSHPRWGESLPDAVQKRMEEELGQKATVVATGGLAKKIVPLCKKDIILDEDLLLKGLWVIYQKNK